MTVTVVKLGAVDFDATSIQRPNGEDWAIKVQDNTSSSSGLDSTKWGTFTEKKTELKRFIDSVTTTLVAQTMYPYDFASTAFSYSADYTETLIEKANNLGATELNLSPEVYKINEAVFEQAFKTKLNDAIDVLTESNLDVSINPGGKLVLFFDNFSLGSTFLKRITATNDNAALCLEFGVQ